MANSQEATIAAIAGCCARIEAMCVDLDQTGWHTPTALPAWDVQDVVAHLGSIEAMLLGRDEPPHQPAVTGHVRNPLGEMNERMVDRRRTWSGADVLAEFRDTTALRLGELAALDEAELERQVPSPTGGMVAQGGFLGVRLWDFFVHEMDIAEALGTAPDLDSAAARRILDEMLFLLPRAVAKGGTPDGEVVAVMLTDPPARSVAVRMEGRRGQPVDPVSAAHPVLRLRASPAVFLRVGAGRRDPEQAISRGDVQVEGDRALAARVLAALNVVP